MKKIQYLTDQLRVAYISTYLEMPESPQRLITGTFLDWWVDNVGNWTLSCDNGCARNYDFKCPFIHSLVATLTRVKKS